MILRLQLIHWQELSMASVFYFRGNYSSAHAQHKWEACLIFKTLFRDGSVYTIQLAPKMLVQLSGNSLAKKFLKAGPVTIFSTEGLRAS